MVVSIPESVSAAAYMWVYRSAEDCVQPVVLFDYQRGRGHEHPQAFLAGDEGPVDDGRIRRLAQLYRALGAVKPE
jgi:hypothetical protein